MPQLRMQQPLLYSYVGHVEHKLYSQAQCAWCVFFCRQWTQLCNTTRRLILSDGNVVSIVLPCTIFEFELFQLFYFTGFLVWEHPKIFGPHSYVCNRWSWQIQFANRNTAWHQNSKPPQKKQVVSCRRETARCFVSLNISLSRSRSFEMTLLRLEK